MGGAVVVVGAKAARVAQPKSWMPHEGGGELGEANYKGAVQVLAV
jgi:hypothetical protein